MGFCPRSRPLANLGFYLVKGEVLGLNKAVQQIVLDAVRILVLNIFLLNTNILLFYSNYKIPTMQSITCNYMLNKYKIRYGIFLLNTDTLVTTKNSSNYVINHLLNTSNKYHFSSY